MRRESRARKIAGAASATTNGSPLAFYFLSPFKRKINLTPIREGELPSYPRECRAKKKIEANADLTRSARLRALLRAGGGGDSKEAKEARVARMARVAREAREAKEA